MRDGGRWRAERDFREFGGGEEVKREEKEEDKKKEDTKEDVRRSEGENAECTGRGGGRGGAERDFQEGLRQASLREEDAMGRDQDTEAEIAGYTIPKESIHIAQSPPPRHCALQQLQTPPNTFVERKKERPVSWNVNEESCKKTKCAGDDGILGRPRGSEPEQTLLYDGVETFGNAVRRADCNGQVLAATDTDYGSDVSTSDNSGCENKIPDKVEYPQLPIYTDSGRADLEEVVHDDCSTTADRPTATPEHFGSALGDTALDTSSCTDYGELPDDVAAFDHISASGPTLEPPSCDEPPLCDEQRALVELIMEGKNVFYTGSAGCGKSTVLKRFVRRLRREGKKVDIIAPTGRAALEVHGRTIHTYAGWVPRSLGQPLRSLKSKAHGKRVQKRLAATEILVIDEISMVANHLFERLNCIMKSARYSEEPFGGVQIIVAGDFCQLAPVKAFEYCLQC